MKRKRLIPFSWLPGAWGLQGTTRKVAEIEYYYAEGFDRAFELLKVHYPDQDRTYELKLLDLKSKYQLVDNEEYDYLYNDIVHEADSDEHAIRKMEIDVKHGKASQSNLEELVAEKTLSGEEYELEILRIHLADDRITESEYEKKKADVLKEPWVKILNIDLDKENASVGNFELDWNEHFIALLRDQGYIFANDHIVIDAWLNDLCKHIAIENFGDDIDFMEKIGMGVVNTATHGNPVVNPNMTAQKPDTDQ